MGCLDIVSCLADRHLNFPFYMASDLKRKREDEDLNDEEIELNAETTKVFVLQPNL